MFIIFPFYIKCIYYNAKVSLDHNHNDFAKKAILVSGIITSENTMARI